MNTGLKKMYRIFDEISQSTSNNSRFALKIKVKKILGDRPDSIPSPSPSVKIQNIVRKVDLKANFTANNLNFH